VIARSRRDDAVASSGRCGIDAPGGATVYDGLVADPIRGSFSQCGTSSLPFGPFLLAGCLIVVLLSG